MENQQEEQINSYRDPIPAFADQLLGSDNENDDVGVQSNLSSTLRSLGMLRRDRRSRQDRAQAAPAEQVPDLPRGIILPSVERTEVRQVQDNPEQKKTSLQVYNGQAIANLKRRYPNGLKYELKPVEQKFGDENRLDLADMVESDKEAREKANYFACAICTMVVHGPLECKSCDSLFCNECLDPWAQKNDHCPKKCKGNQAVSFGAMHRFAKQELEGLKFKCKSGQCSSVDKYTAALKHIHTCEEQVQVCPQGCGMGVQGEDFEYHFQIQCPKTKHVCKECDEEIGAEASEHNCIATLKKLLAESRNQNEGLRLQNSGSARSHEQDMRRGVESTGSSLVDDAAPVYFNESEEDEENDYEEYSALVENRCNNGHCLRAQYEPIAAYSNVSCDKCHTSNLNNDDIFYRCGPCSYDLCMACASEIELQ